MKCARSSSKKPSLAGKTTTKTHSTLPASSWNHIIGVYNTLPHVFTPVKAPADARTFSKLKFWSDLPQQFDTQTFLQTATALAIAP